MEMNPSVCPPLRFLLLSTFLGLSWLIYKYGKYFVGWKLQRMKEMQMICWFDIINTKLGIFFYRQSLLRTSVAKIKNFLFIKINAWSSIIWYMSCRQRIFSKKYYQAELKVWNFFLTNHPNNFKTFLKLTLVTTAS